MTAPDTLKRHRVRNSFFRERIPTIIEGKSQTVQHQRDQVNVNSIVARYQSTGFLEHVNPQEPLYGDFSDTPDYHSALIQVRAAQERFASLPAKLRELCDNDPGKLLALVSNPGNRAKLVDLGFEKEALALFGPLPDPKSTPASENTPPVNTNPSPNGDSENESTS